MDFTCIIPFHNERDRILRVLDEVIKIKELDEILLVDDGSTDNTDKQVKKHHPKLTIIRISKNLGKTEAIRLGLKRAQGTYVVLLDADLQNFQHSEVEKAIHAVKTVSSIDMIILKRNNKRLFRANTLISGERILLKKDLFHILDKYQPKNFQLEFAINQYMMDSHKNAYWIPFSALNTSSITKLGMLKGIKKILHMHMDILNYIGFQNAIRQILFFGKREYI